MRFSSRLDDTAANHSPGIHQPRQVGVHRYDWIFGMKKPGFPGMASGAGGRANYRINRISHPS
jgi:hypothetical protein